MIKFKNVSFIALALTWFTSVAYSQDNLINALKNNQSNNSKTAYVFTDVINLANTAVQNQGSSGTCWSYSTNSFLESEMIKAGKEPVELSQLFSARNVYVEKGINYVRMHGAVTLGDGGACHDVINMYRKYGAVPQEVYTGLNYGTKQNKTGELGDIEKGVLEAVVKNANGSLTPNWLKAYTAVIDAYLGAVPENFTFKGKNYTPKTFAKEVVGLNADDYVELSSFNNYPFYSKFTLLVPDNWSFDQVYNVKVNEITDIIDNALKSGYTVAWATDVSERYFNYKNGVAFVPQIPFEEMTEKQRSELFDGPKPEMEITQENRQIAFDNYETTDDHGMHIVGLAKDQNGKEYYIVKNSWGVTNDYKGYLYVTKSFVKYKTTAFLLNKAGLPTSIAKKLGL